jgi:predicted ArsR family transcriptional regulator
MRRKTDRLKQIAKLLIEQGELNCAQIARRLKTHPTIIQRILDENKLLFKVETRPEQRGRGGRIKYYSLSDLGPAAYEISQLTGMAMRSPLTISTTKPNPASAELLKRFDETSKQFIIDMRAKFPKKSD